MSLYNYKQFISESRQSKEEIEAICDKYNIENYTVNEDGTVDVDGNVSLSYKKLSKLPLRFGTVTGDFYCQSNFLKTLDGSPSTVGGVFSCNENNLTSLVGSPTEVGREFFCRDNELTSLVGGPSKVGGMICYNNQLKTLEGCPTELGGSINCDGNWLVSLEGCPSEISGSFRCEDNPLLESLEGGPSTVGKSFIAINCGLTSLVGGPSSVGARYLVNGNKITSFEGFPELHGNDIEPRFGKNPINEIYGNLFNDVKAIHVLNEWEAIYPDTMEVSYLRLVEVYKQFNMEVPKPEDLHFDYYTLVG